MGYATEADVLQIIDTDLTEEEITPFLNVAAVMVTDLLADESYSADLSREIERWLAAHFTAIRDPQLIEEKIGDATAKYGAKVGSGLEATRYGQQVLLLDSNGIFAELGKKVKTPGMVML